MAANPATAGEYIKGHLSHLTSTGEPQASVVDFSLYNIDTLFWSIFTGLLAFFILFLVARKAHSGVPGRLQAAIELVVEMVDNQSKAIVHGDRRFIAPLALMVFLWVMFMNAMDLLPVDLAKFVIKGLGLDGVILAGLGAPEGATFSHRIVATADLNASLGIAIGVLLLMIFYNVKIKGAGGFVHELFCAPFGSNPVLWIPNFVLNLIEFFAKTVSLGMRLFGNMFAGELVFMLIALLGASATAFGYIGHVIAGSVWAIFHILIVVLQAFIFMMLTLVYIGQAHEGH